MAKHWRANACSVDKCWLPLTNACVLCCAVCAVGRALSLPSAAAARAGGTASPSAASSNASAQVAAAHHLHRAMTVACCNDLDMTPEQKADSGERPCVSVLFCQPAVRGRESALSVLPAAATAAANS